MTLGHLSQFDEFHCDLRTYKVLSDYILMLGMFFVVYCVFSSKVHMFNSTSADNSRFWSFSGTLEPFAFYVPGTMFLVNLSFFCFICLFCHPFGGRDSLKKRKIHEEHGARQGGDEDNDESVR